MATPTAHPVLTAAVVVASFACLSTSSGVFAQAPLVRPGTDAESEILDRIRDIQLADGPNSARLVEPLEHLALLLEDRGNLLPASAVLQMAIDVVRINQGLYSLDQAPLLRRLAELEAGIGNAAEAWDLEQTLLALAERHLDDLRTARILRESGDRRMDMLERYEAGEYPPEIVLGCYYDRPTGSRIDSVWDAQDPPECNSGSRRHAKRAILNEAQTFYSESVNIILRNESYSDPLLPELLTDLVHSSYRYANADLGRRSLQYYLAYQTTNAAPWLARIQTLVEMADWDLLHYRGTRLRDAALAAYRQAFDLLHEHEIPQASIDALFSPTVPVVLPSFAATPLVTRAQSASDEYVDVSFVITADGKGARIEIVDASPDLNRAARNALVQSIRRSRFRPVVTDGRFTDSPPFLVRYYVGD